MSEPLGTSLEDVISVIKEIIDRRGADAPTMTRDTRLEELGLDSIEVVELFHALEDLAKCELAPPGSPDDWQTIDDLLRVRAA